MRLYIRQGAFGRKSDIPPAISVPKKETTHTFPINPARVVKSACSSWSSEGQVRSHVERREGSTNEKEPSNRNSTSTHGHQFQLCPRRHLAATAVAKSLQSCLCDPIDGSPPGPAVPGILQARTLEWVAISFSSAWKWKVKVKSLSRVRLLATPWTAAYQAPPSMGFSRQEYWSGFPLPSLSSPGTDPKTTELISWVCQNLSCYMNLLT